MKEEKVLHVMRRGAITCSEETSLRNVAQIMVVNRIRYCAVINKDREVRGLISADNIINIFGLDLDKTRAGDIVIQNPFVTITPGTSLKEAVTLMARNRIEHLIVVSERPESKAVLGLICSSDIVGRMARSEAEGRSS